MAEARRRGDRVGAAPRRPGGHGHRQDARLPRPGDRCRASAPSSPPPPRRCRTSSPPRTSRSSIEQLAGAVRMGGAEGPLQLPLPAAPPRVHRRRPTEQLELDAMASTTTGRGQPPRRAGPAERRPATPPSSTGARRTRRGGSVSVGSDECPGADRCPMGQQCFAELARDRAGAADVSSSTPTSTASTSASGGVILPEHDVVVFDEAHGLEDIMSDTVGVTIAPGRFVALAASCAGSSPTRRSSAR